MQSIFRDDMRIEAAKTVFVDLVFKFILMIQFILLSFFTCLQVYVETKGSND